MASIRAWIIEAAHKIKQSEFLLDGYVLSMIGLGAIMNGALWYYLKWKIDPSEAFVALHFTYALGVDLIGSAAHLYDAPYYAVLFSLANILIARLVYRYDILVAYTLISAIPIFNAVMIFNSVLVTTSGTV